MSQVLVWLLYGLAPVGLLVIVAFVVLLIAAPPQIHAKQKQEIDLLSRVQAESAEQLKQFEPVEWARGLPVADKARRREQWDAAIAEMIDSLRKSGNRKAEIRHCVEKISLRLRKLLLDGEHAAREFADIFQAASGSKRIAEAKENAIAHLADLRGRVPQDQLRLT